MSLKCFAPNTKQIIVASHNPLFQPCFQSADSLSVTLDQGSATPGTRAP